MKRALAALLLTTFFAPLVMLGVFMTVAEQADPAFAAGTAGEGTEALLRNPRVSLSANARADLEAGIVDDRLVWLFGWIAERHSISVGVFKTGHHKYVRGTDRVSNHYYGRAADMLIVDGSPVSSSNGSAFQLVLEVASLEGLLRPDELGHPFGWIGFPGGFTDADHQGHLHIGYSTSPLSFFHDTSSIGFSSSKRIGMQHRPARRGFGTLPPALRPVGERFPPSKPNGRHSGMSSFRFSALSADKSLPLSSSPGEHRLGSADG